MYRRTNLFTPLAALIVCWLCSSLTTEAQSTEKAAIQSFVRSAALGKPLPGEPGPEVAAWLKNNGEAIQDARPGPFPLTQQYVTFYNKDKIYVHVLDWGDKRGLAFPPVTDRLVLKSNVLNGKPVKVQQAPWGLNASVPAADRPNDIDTIVVLQVEGDAVELVAPRTVTAGPLETILLQADTTRLDGGLRHNPGPDWIENWTDARDTINWRIKLPVGGEYEPALTYACPSGCAGAVLELSGGGKSLRFTTRETSGFSGDWQNFEKRLLGRLQLPDGTTDLTLRAIKKSSTDEILRIYGLYLIPVKAKQEIEAATKRAIASRADAAWLRNAKYGVMFHWTPGVKPRMGEAKPFCKAVDDFDVSRFVEMIQETGAAYVIFTSAHGIQWLPAPIAAVERVLPNRTCSRDLLGDLASALDMRGIKLILYYHHGVGDYEWSRASGFYRKDKSQFFENEIAVLKEMGSRYGKKVAGWWFDDRYPLQPFEQLWKATRTGNADRLAAFNSWILPKATEFQDYYAGELGDALKKPPAKGYFDDGGPQAGLSPHILILLDDPWAHGRPDTAIHDPLFKDEDLIRYIDELSARSIPVTMNIGVYQDGTASPATLAQLRAVRRAIRGK